MKFDFAQNMCGRVDILVATNYASFKGHRLQRLYVRAFGAPLPKLTLLMAERGRASWATIGSFRQIWCGIPADETVLITGWNTPGYKGK
jgi:hypothetical protein